jgi:hypothetical protein
MLRLKSWWLRRRYSPIKRTVDEPTLERLERCIAEVRNAAPEDRAIALDGLAYVAGQIMDEASKEWERIVGCPWERYVD